MEVPLRDGPFGQRFLQAGIPANRDSVRKSYFGKEKLQQRFLQETKAIARIPAAKEGCSKDSFSRGRLWQRFLTPKQGFLQQSTISARTPSRREGPSEGSLQATVPSCKGSSQQWLLHQGKTVAKLPAT